MAIDTHSFFSYPLTLMCFFSERSEVSVSRGKHGHQQTNQRLSPVQRIQLYLLCLPERGWGTRRRAVYRVHSTRDVSGVCSTVLRTSTVPNGGSFQEQNEYGFIITSQATPTYHCLVSEPCTSKHASPWHPTALVKQRNR
jgi:hypothetical protein